MNKIMWLDLETTGVKNWQDKITEIAMLYSPDEKGVDSEVQEFHQYIKYDSYPADYDHVAEITGLTPEILEKKGSPEFESFKNLNKLLDECVGKFDPNDKIIIAGYNVKFDIDFLRSFFKNNGHKYFGSYFFSCSIDVMSLVAMALQLELIPSLKNYKLETVADHFQLKFQAHSAIEDIKITREIFYKLYDLIFNQKSSTPSGQPVPAAKIQLDNLNTFLTERYQLNEEKAKSGSDESLKSHCASQNLLIDEMDDILEDKK